MPSFHMLSVAVLLCQVPLLAYAVTYSTAYNTVIYVPSVSDFSTIATYPVAFPQPGDNKIIRPSAGERVTAGSVYTIKWASPVASTVAMELWGDGARAFGAVEGTCTRWLINYDCGIMNYDLRNTGEFVWKIDDWESPYGNEYTVHLKMWITDYTHVDTEKTFPFITYSSNFTIVRLGTEDTTTTSRSTRLMTTTSALPAASTTIVSTTEATTTTTFSSSTIRTSSKPTTSAPPEPSFSEPSESPTSESPDPTSLGSEEPPAPEPTASEAPETTTSGSTEFTTSTPSQSSAAGSSESGGASASASISSAPPNTSANVSRPSFVTLLVILSLMLVTIQ